jgi:hypothetical protein
MKPLGLQLKCWFSPPQCAPLWASWRFSGAGLGGSDSLVLAPTANDGFSSGEGSDLGVLRFLSSLKKGGGGND